MPATGIGLNEVFRITWWVRLVYHFPAIGVTIVRILWTAALFPVICFRKTSRANSVNLCTNNRHRAVWMRSLGYRYIRISRDGQPLTVHPIKLTPGTVVDFVLCLNAYIFHLIFTSLRWLSSTSTNSAVIHAKSEYVLLHSSTQFHQRSIVLIDIFGRHRSTFPWKIFLFCSTEEPYSGSSKSSYQGLETIVRCIFLQVLSARRVSSMHENSWKRFHKIFPKSLLEGWHICLVRLYTSVNLNPVGITDFGLLRFYLLFLFGRFLHTFLLNYRNIILCLFSRTQHLFTSSVFFPMQTQFHRQCGYKFVQTDCVEPCPKFVWNLPWRFSIWSRRSTSDKQSTCLFEIVRHRPGLNQSARSPFWKNASCTLFLRSCKFEFVNLFLAYKIVSILCVGWSISSEDRLLVFWIDARTTNVLPSRTG